MVMHIWLRFGGRLLWSLVVVAALGLFSLWLESARGAMALWGRLGLSSWGAFLLSVLGMAVVFYAAGALGRRSLARCASVAGSWRTEFDLFLSLGRLALVAWSILALSCVACLLVQVVRLSSEVEARLGSWWMLVLLSCCLFSAILSWRWIGRSVAGIDVTRRPAVHGNGDR